MVHDCLGSCYNDLPQPEVVLSPEDSELNYFLWMPGVQYQPRLQKKLSKLRSITAESEAEVEPISVDQVVEEVVRLCYFSLRQSCLSRERRVREIDDYVLEVNTRLCDHVPQKRF